MVKKKILDATQRTEISVDIDILNRVLSEPPVSSDRIDENWKKTRFQAMVSFFDGDRKKTVALGVRCPGAQAAEEGGHIAFQIKFPFSGHCEMC